MNLTIYKRTFEALKHLKGSEERNRLNYSGITSEYMTSYKFQLVNDNGKFSACYRTRKDAEAAKKRMESCLRSS